MTTIVDWRELYAANQAAIHGGTAGGAPAGAATVPALPELPALPARPRLKLPGRAQPDRPSGAGRWEALEVPGAGGRACFLYTPPGLGAGERAPLVVMLHGCTQSAASFAAGTAMNEAADRHGFLVLYPEQARAANQMGCWNWFVAAHQGRGAGEPGFVAGAVERVLDAGGADPARVFAAGLSAGGAMAALLAAAHPERLAGVAVHAGLPVRAAGDLPGAMEAMRGAGAEPPPLELARPVPLLVVHGTADRTVAPVNGRRLVAQWRAATGATGAPETERHDGATLPATLRRWRDPRGRGLVERLEVDGLPHAWSGGTPGGSYTDPRGPGATDLALRFFGIV